jgi:hypothetical protein
MCLLIVQFAIHSVWNRETILASRLKRRPDFGWVWGFTSIWLIA